jgi:hypothetical protein
MATPDPSYLTLSQVALRTGRHPELLRQWCAAGRIPCQRVGGSWVIRERDLAFVDAIARRGHAARTEPEAATDPGRTRILAAVFDNAESADAVAGVLRERFAMQPDAVGTSNVRVNGLAALRLTLVAGRFPEPASVDARRILVGYGGRMVADLDENGASDGASKRQRAALRSRRAKHERGVQATEAERGR